MSLLLHQLDQNRWDSEKSWKDQESKSILTYFAQFGVTRDSFWLMYAILSNYRISFKTPPSPPFLNASMLASMLILCSMSSFFKPFSESHLFWSRDTFWLTYAILSNFRFFYQTPPAPPFQIVAISLVIFVLVSFFKAASVISKLQKWQNSHLHFWPFWQFFLFLILFLVLFNSEWKVFHFFTSIQP